MPESANAIAESGAEADVEIREGRFQRWLALIAGLSSVLSGLEVTYQHHRSSFSRRLMYTPVILSGALAAGGLAGFFSKRAARTLLPTVSVLTFSYGMLEVSPAKRIEVL